MNALNKRIGIVGGGQLGKMMVLEAKRLGFYVTVLDPVMDCPCHSICDEHIAAGFENTAAYFELAEKSDVITYEFEHINSDALDILQQKGSVVYPSVASLKTIQNKYLQKQALQNRGLPVPDFVKVDTAEAAVSAAERFGLPFMLKAATGGYDGKGNVIVKRVDDIAAAFERLGGGNGITVMAERFVDFAMEVSVIACRGIDGARAVYPVAENIHANSILDTTVVPARITQAASDKAKDIADKVMELFEGVGTFCAEMFVGKDGSVYVNEVAPRPHNSGHYTIEGCFANQYENHIRAITGLPLGDTTLIQPCVMVNLLGESNGKAKVCGLEECYRRYGKLHLHVYGKSESKVGRKMGHFTVVDDCLDRALEVAVEVKGLLRIVGE